jgi:hypothetical protein
MTRHAASRFPLEPTGLRGGVACAGATHLESALLNVISIHPYAE